MGRTAMDIRFACPRCDQHIAIDELGAGMEINCPTCQSLCVVPPQAPVRSLPTLMAPPPACSPVMAPSPGQPDQQTQYHCTNPECGSLWFESQLMPLEFGGKTINVCPQCRLGVSKLTKQVSSWVRLPGAFLYPFKGSGIWILLLGTPLLAFMEFGKKMGIGMGVWIATTFVLGFFGMTLINVVWTTADNEVDPLDWPDFSGWDEITQTASQIGLSALLVFAPALLCSVARWGVLGPFSQLLPTTDWAMLGLGFIVFGAVYYPMALLAVAMFDSVAGVNPIIVLPSIFKTPLQYLVVLVLIGFMWFIRQALSLALLVLPLGWRFAAFLPVEFFTFYSLIVSARIMGLLYKANAAKLGWFE